MPTLRAATTSTRHQHLGLALEWVARAISSIRVDCHELQRYWFLGSFSVSQSDSCIREYCRQQHHVHSICEYFVATIPLEPGPVETSNKPRESGTRGFAKTPSSEPRRGPQQPHLGTTTTPRKKQCSLGLSTEFAPFFVRHFSVLIVPPFPALVVFQHHKTQRLARHPIKTLFTTKSPTISFQRKAMGISPYYPVKLSVTGDFRLSANWGGVFIRLYGLQMSLCE